MLLAHLHPRWSQRVWHTQRKEASCKPPHCEHCCPASTEPEAALTHLLTFLTLNPWLRQQPGTGGSSTAQSSSSPSMGVFQVTLLTQFQIRVVFICRAQGAALPAVHLSPLSPFQQPDPEPPRHKRAHILSQPRGTLRHAGQEG